MYYSQHDNQFYGDEAAEVPKGVFDMLLTRLKSKDRIYISGGGTQGGKSWIRQWFLRDRHPETFEKLDEE